MKIPSSIPWQATGKTLGSGGQANVLLVTSREKTNGEQFALKALRNVGSAQAKARFQREITAVKKLDSKWIAKIIDYSEPENEFQYYVMDYYEGAKSLGEIIFSSSNPYYSNPLKCLSFFKQLIYAIRDCEEARPTIVHRDIKPDNILILPDETLRLIDFGVCQIQDGKMITLLDENVGARNYTAPECEAGNDRQIGVHSDFYSASKVLWSAITSQRAFAREKPAFSSQSLFRKLPDDPMSWHLMPIFINTIRLEPKNRFRNTEELLLKIQEVKDLIERNYPPLEEVVERCPSCGNFTITSYDKGYNLFGNPKPHDTSYYICKTCGFTFVRVDDYLANYYKQLNELE